MSDRVPIYYEYAEKALGQGFAFVCRCEPDQFKPESSQAELVHIGPRVRLKS